jgi:hypothetical protein
MEIDGGIALFDNGAGLEGSASEVSAWTLDESAMTLARASTYAGDGITEVSINGDVAQLPNGNLLQNWGSAGFLVEVDSASAEVWRFESSGGRNTAILGFSDFAERVGGPVE